jgi:transcriptional regulator with XRE-family HTH domain
MNGFLAHSTVPIRAYMERHGMTQTDFARQMGVSQSAVSQWLRGEKGISIRTAGRLEKRSGGEIRIATLFPKLYTRMA